MHCHKHKQVKDFLTALYQIFSSISYLNHNQKQLKKKNIWSILSINALISNIKFIAKIETNIRWKASWIPVVSHSKFLYERWFFVLLKRKKKLTTIIINNTIDLWFPFFLCYSSPLENYLQKHPHHPPKHSHKYSLLTND